jgi:hypothetical protein
MVLIDEPKDRIGGLPADSQGVCEMRILVLMATVFALALPGYGRAAQQERGQPTAILVSPIHEAQVVPGDDGMDHVEYGLLVVNAVEQPVTLTSLTVLDPAAKELTRIDGPVLVAATQTLLAPWTSRPRRETRWPSPRIRSRFVPSTRSTAASKISPSSTSRISAVQYSNIRRQERRHTMRVYCLVYSLVVLSHEEV